MAQTFLKKKPNALGKSLAGKKANRVSASGAGKHHGNVRAPTSAASNATAARPNAPKRSAQNTDAKKVTKKLTASITRNIEELMAVRANSLGKLTIMKPLAVEAAKRMEKEEAARKKK